MPELTYECSWSHCNPAVIDQMEKGLQRHGLWTIRYEERGLPTVYAERVPEDVMRKASEWFSKTEPARW